ncbi:hypothetical protein EX30DRAFT_338217 [Ascodesmis nigricans]|uniref:Uncharacterized protein n=1 Tax=Ascodesmis nigricans TaxID=341454 RepID=A0A4S2N365_9PEZI|nr:hypothetical protein EX30DRAFT_338217 [Ascodesmis nigricans]
MISLSTSWAILSGLSRLFALLFTIFMLYALLKLADGPADASYLQALDLDDSKSGQASGALKDPTFGTQDLKYPTHPETYRIVPTAPMFNPGHFDGPMCSTTYQTTPQASGFYTDLSHRTYPIHPSGFNQALQPGPTEAGAQFIIYEGPEHDDATEDDEMIDSGEEGDEKNTFPDRDITKSSGTPTQSKPHPPTRTPLSVWTKLFKSQSPKLSTFTPRNIHPSQSAFSQPTIAQYSGPQAFPSAHPQCARPCAHCALSLSPINPAIRSPIDPFAWMKRRYVPLDVTLEDMVTNREREAEAKREKKREKEMEERRIQMKKEMEKGRLDEMWRRCATGYGCEVCGDKIM